MSLQLSPAQLGVALLCAGAGSVGAFPLAAWLVGHHGPRRASLWSGTLLLLVVTGLGWAPDLPTLMVLMVGFGVFETSFNVAINAVAARMEHSAGRSIMSRLHAWYCVGTFGGALLGSALAGAGIGVGLHFSAVALVAWAVVVVTCAALPPDRPDAQAGPGRLTLPRGPLFTLGVVCFCVAIAEGAITDWSGVYMRDALGAGEGTAPLAFAAFSALELAVRWVADPLKDRWGAQRIVAVGGIAAAAGVGVAAAALNAPLTIAGFALAGAGIAAVFPFIFSAAGRHGATALAGVATMGAYAEPKPAEGTYCSAARDSRLPSWCSSRRGTASCRRRASSSPRRRCRSSRSRSCSRRCRRSSSFFRSWPMWPSCSTMPSGASPRPVLPCDSALRWVKMCMRVVLNQTNQGLPSCCFASMNLTVSGEHLLVDRLHPLLRQRTGVLAALLAPLPEAGVVGEGAGGVRRVAVEHAARAEPLLELRVLRVVGVLGLLLRRSGGRSCRRTRRSRGPSG